MFFGCASTENVSLISEYDNTAKFNEYQTFVICIDDLFVENTSYPEYDNNYIRQLIGKEIENQMIDYGYKTNVIRPQLQSGFQILLVKKEASFTNCDLQEDYSYWKACTINTVVYTEQTLVVYVSDLEKNQIIWQASINCDLNKNKNLLKSYIPDLVEKLFKEYPKTN